MIVRLWKGTANRGDEGAYLRHLEESVFPEIRAIPGFIRARVLRRAEPGGDEFLVMTCWADMESIKAFAGADPEVAVVPPEAQALLASFDRRVQHFEVALEVP